MDIHECAMRKKYAYLSDYVRLWAVEKYGGIYLDTDVEVIRPLEKLLQEDAYFGFENKRYVNTGLGLDPLRMEQCFGRC